MNEFPLDVVTLFTMDAITDSDFPVDGVQRLRQSKKFLLPKYDFDFEQYIRLFDVNKIHFLPSGAQNVLGVCQILH